MNLAIIVPVFNRKVITLKFLALLKRQTFQDFTTIIVDDGSQDGTDLAVKNEFPDVHIIKGTGDWWWTKSVNEGIKYAETLGNSAMLLMNNDTYFEPDYLETLILSSKAYPDSIIGSLSLTYEKPLRIFFSGIKQLKILSSKGCRYHPAFALYEGGLTGTKPSIALPGRGLLIPVSVIRECGYFEEEKLPQYGADEAYVTKIYRDNNKLSYISWDAIVYTYTSMTGKGATFSDETLIDFIKTFFTPKSRQYLPDKWHMAQIRFGKIKGIAGFCFSITRSLHGFLKKNSFKTLSEY
jgi:GT2 family glycosyltransferase